MGTDQICAYLFEHNLLSIQLTNHCCPGKSKRLPSVSSPPLAVRFFANTQKDSNLRRFIEGGGGGGGGGAAPPPPHPPSPKP
jgi:hypothetical protein